MLVIQTILKHIEARVAHALLRLPDRLLYALSGGQRVNQSGHQLDARIQLGLVLQRAKPALETLPPQIARRQLREMVTIFDLPPESLPRVENLSIPGVAKISTRIPLRLYAPTNQAKDLPTLLYFHGGGFVVGDLDTYDAMLRYVCKKVGCIIISVDYRLAPDHPFPAAVDDALATYAWIQKHGPLFGVDVKRLGVGGDSAGGNLALNICLAGAGALPRLKAPAFQTLIYPWIDLYEAHTQDASFKEFATGFALTAALIEYFTRHAFLSTQKLQDPRVSPLLAPAAGLKRVPPTLLQLCGFDPLRDQGVRLAARLNDAGVDCETKLYPTLIHGATGLAGIVPDAREMLDDFARGLAKLSGSAPAIADRPRKSVLPAATPTPDEDS